MRVGVRLFTDDATLDSERDSDTVPSRVAVFFVPENVPCDEADNELVGSVDAVAAIVELACDEDNVFGFVGVRVGGIRFEAVIGTLTEVVGVIETVLVADCTLELDGERVISRDNERDDVMLTELLGDSETDCSWLSVPGEKDSDNVVDLVNEASREVLGDELDDHDILTDADTVLDCDNVTDLEDVTSSLELDEGEVDSDKLVVRLICEVSDGDPDTVIEMEAVLLDEIDFVLEMGNVGLCVGVPLALVTVPTSIEEEVLAVCDDELVSDDKANDTVREMDGASQTQPSSV